MNPSYAVGHVLAEAGSPVGGYADAQSHLLIAPAAFPNLAAVFNSGWSYDPYRQFDRTLRAIVGCEPPSERPAQKTGESA